MNTIILGFMLLSGIDDLRAPITQEQTALIQQLGDPIFQNREKATIALEKMGYPAIRSLERGCRSNDPEIVHRCRNILAQYYNVGIGKRTPNIYFMLESERFPDGINGIDVAKEYYHQAYVEYRNNCKRYDLGVNLNQNDWNHDEIAKAATELKVREMLYWGVKKDDVLKYLEEMCDRTKTYYLDIRYYDDNAEYNNGATPPPFMKMNGERKGDECAHENAQKRRELEAEIIDIASRVHMWIDETVEHVLSGLRKKNVCMPPK